ncbi:MAG: hypothetical protein WCD57_18475 [Acidobacteriaceae bacterium]
MRGNPKRGIGFEEVLELFSHPYYQDNRSDLPEQHRAIGWTGERLYSVIFEVRQDEECELYQTCPNYIFAIAAKERPTHGYAGWWVFALYQGTTLVGP